MFGVSFLKYYLAAVCVLGFQGPVPNPTPPFESWAKEFAGFYAGKMGGEPEIGEYLRREFLVANLGYFDLAIPESLWEEKGGIADLQRIAAALLESQSRFLDLVVTDANQRKELRESADTIEAWIKTWNAVAFAKAMKGETRTLHELPGTKLELSPAVAKFAGAMRQGAVLPGSIASLPGQRLVLLPSRKEFLQLHAYYGWKEPTRRSELWHPSAVNRLSFFLADSTLVCALRYASAEASQGNWFDALDMNKNTKTGREQNVLQAALESMFKAILGADVDPSWIRGMATETVIAVVGENNARSTGESAGRTTGGSTFFVAGGNASGGTMGGADAEQRWRQGHGKDHFVQLLQRAQKDGAKMAKDSKDATRSFVLLDANSKKFLAQAPFLGKPSRNRPQPPAEFSGDCQEFLRAYRACFFYWLGNHAKLGASPVATGQAWSKLLTAMLQARGGREIDSLVSELFPGLTLSTERPGESSLEGKFLIWLATGK